MRIIDTSQITEELPSDLRYWTYNGLDSCVTAEIAQELRPQLEASANAKLIYNFERAMQAPALSIMLQGIRVDPERRRFFIHELTKKKDMLEKALNAFADSVWNKPLNPNSPKQLQDFFYGVMNLPQQFKFEKGVKRVSTDREALEKLWLYFFARPITQTILALRDTTKRLSVLSTGVDPDGRMRFGINVAGTETGRWSSNKNVFGRGTNGQNITEGLRSIFAADPNYKMAYLDLEQAESRDVGLLAWAVTGDASYLNACESGDLHTTVSKMVWPTALPWHENDNDGNKRLAESPFYRHFTYRDMSKRGGHGTNYYGKPPTMARHVKVRTNVMADFQNAYFTAFPCIPEWHQWTIGEIQTKGELTTLFGRTRTFFGRSSDETTFREGIAYSPQSMVGDRLNLGLWRVWKHWGKVLYKGRPAIQILLQVHDAVVLQYLAEAERWILPELVRCLTVPVTAHRGDQHRSMVIPVDVAVGWNWGKQVTEADILKKHKSLADAARFGHYPNPWGLMKWKGKDTRQPPPSPRPFSILASRIG